MAPGWREIASRHVERITGYVRDILSSGLVFLRSELGIDLGLNPESLAPWVILFTAWTGLVLMLILWVSLCRGVWRRLPAGDTRAPPETKKTDHQPDEQRKRNRRRNAEKKSQRDDPEEDVKVSDAPEPHEVKADKAKKSKKKQKSSVKEKSSASVDGKEPDEGDWETKISNREKRQQRRKDKTPGDGSGSPEATAPSSGVRMTEPVQTTPEDPETTIKSTASTPAVQRKDSSPPETKASYVRETVAPQVTRCWEEVLSVNGSGWSDLGLQGSAQMSSVPTESWTNMSLSADPNITEPSVWPQDMEGSWTIVDGSHIPVSFGGLTAVPAVPNLSWASQQPPVEADDEWSGLNTTSADAPGDWNAPSEEWGNCVEQQPISTAPAPLDQPIPAEPQQESDVEKEKNETLAPGSGKAKKKKKKKKKADEAAGQSAQIQTQMKAERDLSTGPQSVAGRVSAASAEMRVEAEPPAVSSLQTQQRMCAPASADQPPPVPTQKKAEESRESPKPVKKKKARRET